MKKELKPSHETLKRLLQEHKDNPYILREFEPRRRWTAEATASLKFNPTLYSTSIETSDAFCRPNFSSNFYEHSEHRMLSLVQQGIAELENGYEEAPFKPTEEHSPIWYIRNCTIKHRIWVVSIFSTLVTTSYLLGKNHFLSQLIELCKNCTK